MLFARVGGLAPPTARLFTEQQPARGWARGLLLEEQPGDCGCAGAGAPATKQPGTSPGCRKASPPRSVGKLPASFECVQNQARSKSFISLDPPPTGPGGDEGARTPDIRLAKAALSQLSYIPRVGLSGLEPLTFPLSEGCSNQLS